MKIKELLPVGSIVLLKDGEKRLMIIGIMQTETEGSKEEYDYLGVLYPEGHVGDEYRYLFNHNDIQEIYFRGYDDEERSAFLERLSQIYKQ